VAGLSASSFAGFEQPASTADISIALATIIKAFFCITHSFQVFPDV
jgi:hypothetical protein